MDPIFDESWKCSKLIRKPHFNQWDQKWLFSLIWIAPSHAKSGYKLTKGKSYTKEISRPNTEEECLDGVNKLIMSTRAYRDVRR